MIGLCGLGQRTAARKHYRNAGFVPGLQPRTGVATLERFTRREPLRRVHEAVFGVLALESEPVDPRL